MLTIHVDDVALASSQKIRKQINANLSKRFGQTKLQVNKSQHTRRDYEQFPDKSISTSFTIFMAWLIKFVMIKVGGPTVYRKSRPLFIGLLVGYILGVILSTGIDFIWFPERGHGVHRYG